MKKPHRLFGQLILAIICLLGIALIGNHFLENIESEASAANTKSIQGILKLEQASRNFLRYRTRVLNHILATDPQKMAEHDQQLSNYRASIENALNDYAALAVHAEDKQLLADDRQTIERYYVEVESALVLSRQNRNEEARNLTQGEIFERADAVVRQFDRHMKYNADQAKQANQSAQSTYRSTSILIFVGLLIVVIGILLIGLRA